MPKDPKDPKNPVSHDPVTPPEIPTSPLYQQQPLDSVQATLLLSVGELKGRVAQLEDQARRTADRLDRFSEKLYLALGVGAVIGLVMKFIFDAVKK
jgi:hypothetical protein